MNEIDELEALVTEEAPEPPIDKSPIKNSTFAYHAVVIVLDLISGGIVGYLTFWFYGVIWFLAGAIAFFQHHKNWESPTNNDYQQKNSTIGMIVSVVAVGVMALASGAVLVLTSRGLLAIDGGYIAAFVELVTVSLFIWNGYQFAMYKFKDDSFVIARQIARAQANAHKKIEFAKAAGSVVDANRKFITERNVQRNKHGAGAVDAALNKLQGRNAAQMPMNANAADTTLLTEIVDIPKNSPAGKSSQD